MHRSLYTTDQEREVERLLKMGATLYSRGDKSDEDFKIPVDPEGNHFCKSKYPKTKRHSQQSTTS